MKTAAKGPGEVVEDLLSRIEQRRALVLRL